MRTWYEDEADEAGAKNGLDGGSTAQDIVSKINRIQGRNRRIRRISYFVKKLKPMFADVYDSDDKTLRAFVASNVARWGVRPGTQIFYKGAFGSKKLQHHGVYLGQGLVCEVGGQWCKSTASGFLEQCLSFNTLYDFVLRGKGEIFEVRYRDIDLGDKFNPGGDLDILRAQLQRALQLTEQVDWNYNPFTNNCQHWSSYVVTGNARMTQCEIQRRFTTHQLDLKKAKSCQGKPCRMQYTTTDNHACKDSVQGGLFGKWCKTDNSWGWGYVSQRKPVYGCERGKGNVRRLFHRCVPE